MDDIGGWMRQARHRAKKHHAISNLTADEVHAVILEHNSNCAYCDSPYETLDHPLPLSDGGPNTIANVLPCCRRCKLVKRNKSLTWMLHSGMIQEDTYLSLIRTMLSRDVTGAVRITLQHSIGLVED